jgi:hypothetical protein
MPAPNQADRLALARHVSAARAFHTGLIAETHRRLSILTQMAEHLDVLRSPGAAAATKITAIEVSCRHLVALGKPGDWRGTYRDLRGSLHAIRAHLKRGE